MPHMAIKSFYLFSNIGWSVGVDFFFFISLNWRVESFYLLEISMLLLHCLFLLFGGLLFSEFLHVFFDCISHLTSLLEWK